MADVKISDLPASTTPLAGTEVLPVVQGGQTRQVSVANLTAGRAVNALSLTASSLTAGRVPFVETAGLLSDSANLVWDNANARIGVNVAPAYALDVTLPAGSALARFSGPEYSQIVFRGDIQYSYIQNIIGLTVLGSAAGSSILFSPSEVERMRLHSSGGVSIGDTTNPGVGNLRLGTGNLVIGTAGKGISLPGGITWTSGSGSPEGVVTAPVGSLYSRSDGGLLTSLYVKESGSGNTGWVGK